jgi:hypothetical protein
MRAMVLAQLQCYVRETIDELDSIQQVHSTGHACYDMIYL